jgi:hypothetical protein
MLPRHVRSRTLLGLSAAALLAAAPAAAQEAGGAVLDLVVREAATHEPLGDARVEVEGLRYPAWSDRRGRARMANVPPGERVVTVHRPGYAAQRFSVDFARERVEREISLRRLPIALAPIEVVAEQQLRALRERDFYDRVRHGHGSVIMRDEIERMRPRTTMDVMRRLRGFQVEYTPRGELRLSSGRGRASFEVRSVLDGPQGPDRGSQDRGVDRRVRPTERVCDPQIYLDGALIWMPAGLVDPSEIVNPDQIEAIEAYPGGATIPPELNATGSACGVVAIWTRAGS